MKIGTLTFHRAINFGAVLQTYALQKKLRNMGIDSEVIDYRNPYLEKLHNPHYLQKYLNLRYTISGILKNNLFRDNRKNFYNFIEKNIKLSNKIYYTSNELQQCNNIYDKVIVGSDQVWNYICSNSDTAYFLDFVDKFKRYSYAASLGIKEIPQNYREKYYNYLTKMQKISVREAQAANTLKELLNQEIPVVLDPTFLINKNEWQKLCAKRKKIRKKYVFIYLIGKSKSAFNYAKKIAQRNNLDIIYLNENYFPVKGVKNLFYVKPEEWLWLINNAEYIVTNSFHGMSLSIIFNKEFMIDTGIKYKDYSRMYNILELLEIKNRLINPNIDIISSKIDYTKVKKILDKQIDKSTQFLKGVINDEKTKK